MSDKVKLGDIVREVKESTKNPISEGLERYIGLEHLDPESLKIKRWGLLTEGTTFTRKFFPGQVLFGKRRAYQRKVAVAEFPGVCSGDIIVLESRNPDKLLPDLLPYLMQSDSLFEHALITSSGSLSPRTKWKELANFIIPAQCLEKQKDQISLLQSIEDSLSKTEESYSCLKNYRTSLLKSIMSMQFKSKEIDATKWKSTKLRNISKISSGGTPDRKKLEYWENAEISWVKTGEINYKVILNTEESISKLGLKHSAAKIIPKGTLLMAMYGQGPTRGRVAILGKNAAVSQACAAINLNSQVADCKFYYYFFECMYHKIRNFSQENSQKNLLSLCGFSGSLS